VDHISLRYAASLAHAGRSFMLPVSVGGHPLLTLDWPLQFERPDNLVFFPIFGKGPDLRVKVDYTDPSRYSFTVSREDSNYMAVVEATDLPTFRVVSRGTAGSTGAPGMNGFDGTPGLDGSNASCPWRSADCANVKQTRKQLNLHPRGTTRSSCELGAFLSTRWNHSHGTVAFATPFHRFPACRPVLEFDARVVHRRRLCRGRLAAATPTPNARVCLIRATIWSHCRRIGSVRR
jgi:hypothetical protein